MATPRQLEQMYRWIENNPWRFMWHSAKMRAKRDGRACTITEDDIRRAWPADGICPALGIPLVMPKRGYTGNGVASLDRVDNSQGYVPGNIAIISRRANTLKRQHNAAGLTIAAAATEAASKADELRRIAAWLERVAE